MTASQIVDLVVSVAQGAAGAAIFLLILFIGVCVALGFVKLRPSGPRSLTVRSLDEALGQPVAYLPPDEPRGTTNQLDGARRVA